MGEIIFGVSENEGRVPDFVTLIGEPGLCGRRDARRPLSSFDGGPGSGQPDEALVKIVEPRPQHRNEGWPSR